MNPTDNAFVKIKDDVQSTVKRIKRKSQDISEKVKRAPKALEDSSKETLREAVEILKNDGKIPSKWNVDETSDALLQVVLMLGCLYVGSFVGRIQFLSLMKPIVDVVSVTAISYISVPALIVFGKFERLESHHLCLIAAMQGVSMGYIFEGFSDPNVFPIGIMHALLSVFLVRFCASQAQSDRRQFFALFCMVSFTVLMTITKFGTRAVVFFSLLANASYVAGSFAIFQFYFESIRAGQNRVTAFKIGFLTLALYIQTILRLVFGVEMAANPKSKVEA
ncbi:hypothetical protein L596_027669 [Steinernema carpocapsae]|uniref:Uncharacterized protein n=1 Tax=Steinernema carpocapsae TaxID=34508 RepID=A0A4U5LW74_STECR|nr:hypothetical protein L596_027669 [Steinernema carpocapsae]